MEVPTSAPRWSSIVMQQPSSDHNAQETVATADQALVGSCNSAKGVAVAVVDANAIIQGGERLTNFAEKFVSVPEVIGEVRDPNSRHSLRLLPFTVDTVEPSPESLKKVIKFARETGDLQTLSDVDLKLIALTYTLEAQIHGTNHLRDIPPPIHTVNVRRLPEKDMPGWGSNVSNLEEWEALEHAVENGSNLNSRILPPKDLNISADQHIIENGSTCNDSEHHFEDIGEGGDSSGKPRKYLPKKKGVKIEGKKMVADGIDASQGQYEDDAGGWCPAVSRSTRRRYLRRKTKREMAEASSEKHDEHDVSANMEIGDFENTKMPDLVDESFEENKVKKNYSEEKNIIEEENSNEDLSSILHQMRLEEDSVKALQDDLDPSLSCEGHEETNNPEVVSITENGGDDTACGADDIEISNQDLEELETSSQSSESHLAPSTDDSVSEQSWMLRSLSDSSVACVTNDFAMQNVLLQMGLRLLAPGGRQIRELHRWVLKCHACYKVTTEIGKIFCPKCGNGGTLRKVAVTVNENGIVLAAHRPRISLRGTKFSLPLPQGGRDAITRNPILREDQLPQKFLYPKTKKKNKLGEDAFTSSDIFLHHNEKKAPLQPPVRKALAVFSGRRNPNDNHFSRAMH